MFKRKERKKPCDLVQFIVELLQELSIHTIISWGAFIIDEWGTL